MHLIKGGHHTRQHVSIVETKKQTGKPCEEVYLMCSAHELDKCKIDGGNTPPLARKLPQRFADFICLALGDSTQLNSRHNTITNCAAEAIFCCPTENSHHLKS